jgi:catechol 2,3-dioxygenase-like lactoylglutathione lyase family enzyme
MINRISRRRRRPMDWKLEVVVVPVSDVDRAKDFYADKLGFSLDRDVRPNEDFRVVQVTPPGSACSIVFGQGLPQGAPGSVKGNQFVVRVTVRPLPTCKPPGSRSPVPCTSRTVA